MATTSKMGIPYPASSDLVTDGATDMQSLAEEVDLRTGLVKIIPSGATNGTVGANGDVTVGSAVSSVSVADAFSADFKNYRIVISGIVASVIGDLRLALGSSATGSAYFGSYYFDLYTGAGTGTTRFNNTTTFNCCGLTTTNESSSSFDICKPQLGQRTSFHGQAFGNGYALWFAGTQASTTAFTAITFSPISGTITGGTISIYGYN